MVVLLASVFGLIASLDLTGLPNQLVLSNCTYANDGSYTCPKEAMPKGLYFQYTTIRYTTPYGYFTMPVNDTASMTVHFNGMPDVVMCCGDTMTIIRDMLFSYPVIQPAWLIITFSAIITGIMLFAILKSRESQIETPKEPQGEAEEKE